MMRKVAAYAGVALIVGAMIAVFIAYFVRSVNVEAGLWFDGFGRALSETPWVVRYVFGKDSQWAGWSWFIADLVMFWGAIGLGAMLINAGHTKPRS